MGDSITDETARSPRRRSRWRKPLIVLGAIALVLVLAWQGFEAYARVRLNRVLAQARAGGVPLTREEIVAHRPRLPADQDGARVFLSVQGRLRGAVADKSLKSLPLMGGPDLPPVGFKWSDEQQAAVGTVLERFRPEMDALDAIRAYPRGCLPFEIARVPVDNLFPQLDELRLAMKLRSLRVLHDAMQGKTARTVDDLTVAFRLVGLLSTHPTLSGAMLKIAGESLTASTIERVCGVLSLSQDQLLTLEAMLEQAESEDPLWWGLLGERAVFYDTGVMILRTGTSPVNHIRAPGYWPCLRGLMRLDMELGIRAINRLIEPGPDPDKRLAAMESYGREFPRDTEGYPYTETMVASEGHGCALDLLGRVESRAARVALAAERYRLDNGKFPASPEELVPTYIRQIPRDPFGGKPLQYRVTPDGIQFYSVWRDEELDERRARDHRERAPDRGFQLVVPERRGQPAVQSNSVSRKEK